VVWTSDFPLGAAALRQLRRAIRLENPADPKLHKQFILEAVHLAKATGGFIVEPAQVQHSMNRVEQQLMAERQATDFSLPAGLGNANDHLAGDDPAAVVVVELKGKDIGWAGNPEVLLVQGAHGGVVDQNNREFSQSRAKQGVGGFEVAGEMGDGSLGNLGSYVQAEGVDGRFGTAARGERSGGEAVLE